MVKEFKYVEVSLKKHHLEDNLKQIDAISDNYRNDGWYLIDAILSEENKTLKCIFSNCNQLLEAFY